MAAVRAALQSAKTSNGVRFAPAVRNFAAAVKFASPAEVQAGFKAKIDAKSDLYGDLNKEGLGYDQFKALMQEVCPTVGEREQHALFASMDTSGDGLIEADELFKDVVLRVIHTRAALGHLHPVEGSFSSLPRPPFVQDDRQTAVVSKLCQIYDNVVGDHEEGKLLYTPKPMSQTLAKTMPKAQGGLFSKIAGQVKRVGGARPKKRAAYKAPEYNARKGLYIVGSSGSGKTALLDVFFRSLPEKFPVARLNYTEFCRDGFNYMTQAKEGQMRGRTPFDVMADNMAKRCRVLLLDGLDISQVSEVLLVKEFFRAMWLRGITVITTANVPINKLYYGGAGREELLDFLPEFEERCPEVELSGAMDYRTLDAESSGVFYTGLTPENKAKADEAFKALVHGKIEENYKVQTGSRFIETVGVGVDDAVAKFDFGELFGKAMGSTDYALIATKYSTIFIDNVPQLSEGQMAEFRRFASFIDMAYDKKVNLHVTSEVNCEDIYAESPSLTPDDVRILLRYKSIMTEMASTKYPAMAWLMRPSLVSDKATSL